MDRSKFTNDDYSIGAALFVLKDLGVLTMHTIFTVWETYEETFGSALKSIGGELRTTDLYGPFWDIPHKQEDCVEKKLFSDCLIETKDRKRPFGLSITPKGEEHLACLLKRGMSFKGWNKERAKYAIRR